MQQGKLITFEGIDGSGKTTQASMLYERLKKDSMCTVCLTKEPGGTVVGDAIREIILSETQPIQSMYTELFLYEASRAELCVDIKQKLNHGMSVICDRFYDASVAYQGYGRLISIHTITTLNMIASQGITPDITVLLDIDPSIAMQRVMARNLCSNTTQDRIEQEHLTFHERVRQGYLEIAHRFPGRFLVYNGNIDIQQLHVSIFSDIANRLSW